MDTTKKVGTFRFSVRWYVFLKRFDYVINRRTENNTRSFSRKV